MKMNFSIPVAALFVGAALGYCFAPGGGGKDGAADAAAEKPSAKVVRVGLSDKGSVDALRSRVKELEAKLRELEGRGAAPDGGAGAASERRVDEGGGRRRGGHRNPGEWLENLKRENPGRYAEVTNNMARMRMRRAERAQSQMDFLASWNDSAMTPAALEVHERLQALLAKREELMRSFDEAMSGDGAAASEEDRRAAEREMHETMREIRELNREERTNLIRQTAEAYGFTGEDVDEIADTIGEIISATEGGMHGAPPPGGRGGPGGGGMRGGGGPGGGR